MKQNGKKNALLESAPPFYVVIRATQRSSRLPCKGSEPWPAPGIEPAISYSELKRSTDWANPAAVTESEVLKMAPRSLRTSKEQSLSYIMAITCRTTLKRCIENTFTEIQWHWIVLVCYIF